jgi:uncharacterized membrane protein
MPASETPFGRRDPHDLARSGRRFVVVGALLVALGIAVLAVPLFSFISLAISEQPLVQYAGYMLEAQLIVHAIFFAILVVPAAFLIQQGRKRIRAGGT